MGGCHHCKHFNPYMHDNEGDAFPSHTLFLECKKGVFYQYFDTNIDIKEWEKILEHGDNCFYFDNGEPAK